MSSSLSDASSAATTDAKDLGSESRSYGTVNGNLTNGAPGSTAQDEERSLPTHSRRAAWSFLVGCFWLEALIWGLPFSYGIFKEYYSSHVLFSSEKGIATVGTTCMGLAYFGGPATFYVLQQWPSRRRQVSVVGLVLIVAALVMASFATRAIHLILTQGLLYGIGGALLYNPFLIYVEEWFPKQKGFAYSIVWAGTGFSGAVVPFIVEWALDKYGFRITLRAWALFIAVTLSFLVYFLRPPRPLPTTGIIPKMSFDFLKSPLFWAFQLGNIVEGLGYFMPQVYLSSYARSIGLPDLAGIISISLLNLFSTAGLILMGLLVDRYHISTVLLISALSSTFCVFFLWGFALNEPVLYLFSITFGIFAGGYVATWTGCALEVQKSSTDSDVSSINGFMAAGRGFGCVLGGPLSEALLSFKPMEAKGAYGTRYGALIIFTGISSLMGRFGLFGRWGLQAGQKEIKIAKTQSEEREPLIR